MVKIWIRNFTIILVAMILLSGCVTQRKTLEAVRAYNEGVGFENEDDYENAKDYYLKALDIYKKYDAARKAFRELNRIKYIKNKIRSKFEKVQSHYDNKPSRFSINKSEIKSEPFEVKKLIEILKVFNKGIENENKGFLRKAYLCYLRANCILDKSDSKKGIYKELKDSAQKSKGHIWKNLLKKFKKNTILWKTKKVSLIHTLKRHSKDVWSVSFSPDGKILASGSLDKTIKIWDIETGREISTLKGHSDSVYSVSFSMDGKILASGSDDDTIKIWQPK